MMQDASQENQKNPKRQDEKKCNKKTEEWTKKENGKLRSGDDLNANQAAAPLSIKHSWPRNTTYDKRIT